MKKIILAGGGHGHINILKNLIKNPIVDCEISLITDNKRQYYSGMLAGFIEGIYTEEEISFDVPDLCKRAGVKYIEEKITKIDKKNQELITEYGKYPYDLLSINLGSISKLLFSVNSSLVSLVKPIGNVVRDKAIIDKIVKEKQGANITFIGGGASGVELALSFRAAYPSAGITIITANEILENFNDSARKKFLKIFKEKNIEVFSHERVSEIIDNTIITDKAVHDFDYAFITSGFRGIDVDFDGFMTDDKNYLYVEDDLSASNNVLAMGDSASIKIYPTMPKAGVFAIREAPILYNNLLAMINGEDKLKTYKPQLKYLQIINCGNKKALSNYGNFASFGSLSWKIKDKIDRDYMKV